MMRAAQRWLNEPRRERRAQHDTAVANPDANDDDQPAQQGPMTPPSRPQSGWNNRCGRAY